MDIQGVSYKVFSRLYNSKGKPLSPFSKVLPVTLKVADHASEHSPILYVDVCYNSTDNKFLLIWISKEYDAIYGIKLNARGNRKGIKSKIFTLKKRSNVFGSAFYPLIVWVPGKDLYAMGFLSVDVWSLPKNMPKNGYYLSTFTTSVTPKNTKKKVKSVKVFHQMFPLTTLLAVGNKLFWGSGEEIDKDWKRPSVWMTKHTGKNLSATPAIRSGVIYPGQKAKYINSVNAAYDPGRDRFLVTWMHSDKDLEMDRISQSNSFRIMNGDGNFIGKEQKVPQAQHYQSQAKVTFDQMDDHFFLVCAEYKILTDAGLASTSSLLDSKLLWGGKLWGYKFNTRGKKIGSRIPLSKVFTDVDLSLSFSGAYYNSFDDQHFVTYYLNNIVTHKSQAFVCSAKKFARYYK